MVRWLLFFLLVLCFRESFLKSVGKHREKRWFGYRYTKTVIQPQIVTSLIPSSCVQVEPSLKPCRNVRYLNHFPNVVSGRLLSGEVEISNNEEQHQELSVAQSDDYGIETTPLGWGEYLGLYAPTVTTTAIHRETTTMMDPRTVVTFSVRGCRPSTLPMDLDMCPESEVPILPSRVSKEVMTTTVFKPEVSSPDSIHGSERDYSTTPTLATEDLLTTINDQK